MPSRITDLSKSHKCRHDSTQAEAGAGRHQKLVLKTGSHVATAADSSSDMDMKQGFADPTAYQHDPFSWGGGGFGGGDISQTQPLTAEKSSQNRRAGTSVSFVATLLVDFAALSLTVGLVVFICVVATTDGREVDASFPHFNNALTVLGPLFPMIFAFIMSRFLYHLARQRLGQGASLGTLEQLMGSHTLGAAVGTHLSLRVMNLLGLALLGVWLLSPLGGQALLRILGSGTKPVDTTVEYIDNYATIKTSAYMGSTAYCNALFAPEDISRGPRDAWGNVKIPFPAKDARGKIHEDWQPVESGTEVRYTSFVGIPLANVPFGNTVFSLESTYIDLSCSDATVTEWAPTATSFFDGSETMLNQTYYESGESFLSGAKFFANGTWYGVQQPEPKPFDEWDPDEDSAYWWNLALDGFVDDLWYRSFPEGVGSWSTGKFHTGELRAFESEEGIEARPTRLLFQARQIQEDEDESTPGPDGEDEYAEIRSVYKSECLVTQKYAESRIACFRAPGSSRPECSVAAQRASRKPRPTENISQLSHPKLFRALSSDLPKLGTRDCGKIYPDATLWYILKHSMAGYSQAAFPPLLTNMSTSDLSIGLATAINSYVLADQLDSYFLQQLSVEKETMHFDISWADAAAVTSDYVRIYVVSWPWLFLCLLSCSALAGLAVLGVIFVHKGGSPEILGYVSTVLRDSRHVDVSREAEGQDGPGLSRLLKGQRLRFGHVLSSGSGGRDGYTVGIGREEETVKVK